MSESHGESLGSIILHHVTNDLGYKFLDLHLFGYDISITKHVVMLWIAAAITVALAIYGTRRYRQSENAQPRGLSHLYEILINFIRDDMRVGDLALFYHSNCDEPGVVGIIEIVRSAYPDHTAFHPEEQYFDPKSNFLYIHIFR